MDSPTPTPNSEKYQLDQISPVALGEVLDQLMTDRLDREPSNAEIRDIARARSFSRPNPDDPVIVPAHGLNELMVSMHVALRAHASQYKILDMKKLGLEEKEKELKEKLNLYTAPDANFEEKGYARYFAAKIFVEILQALGKLPEVPIKTPKGTVMVQNAPRGFEKYNTLAQMIFALPYASRAIFNEAIYPGDMGQAIADTLGTTTEISEKIRHIRTEFSKAGVDFEIKRMIPGAEIAALLPKNAGILNAIARYSPLLQKFNEANGIDPNSKAIATPQDGAHILRLIDLHELSCDPKQEWIPVREKAEALVEKPSKTKLADFEKALRHYEKALRKYATQKPNTLVADEMSACVEKTLEVARALVPEASKSHVNRLARNTSRNHSRN